jgi:hypothetical protein
MDNVLKHYNLQPLQFEGDVTSYTRLKKRALIVSQNPTWEDLSLELYAKHRYEPERSVRNT